MINNLINKIIKKHIYNLNNFMIKYMNNFNNIIRIN